WPGACSSPGGGMAGKSAEIAKEQDYFDAAAKARAAALAELADAAKAAANPAAARYLDRHARAAGQAIGRAGAAVAVGRIDAESGDVLYIGRQLIRDGHDVLVVSWQAPAASPYYQASYADPRGLRRKRTFECAGNTIKDFTDVVFAQIAYAVDQHLLGEL